MTKFFIFYFLLGILLTAKSVADMLDKYDENNLEDFLPNFTRLAKASPVLSLFVIIMIVALWPIWALVDIYAYVKCKCEKTKKEG